MQTTSRTGPDHIRRLKRNRHFQRWLRKYLSENKQDEEKETPSDGDEPAIKSLNVTSLSLPAMEVADMDKVMQDAVLHARSIKVPARMVQKSLDTAGYVRRVVRRPRTRKSTDPSTCKSS